MSLHLSIGFLPLTDCAPLVIARERGFFAEQDLDVELRKSQSWAQVRDRLDAGEIDAAHMLITMPLQAALSPGAGKEAFSYAYALSRHGNGIILSNALWNAGARDPSGLARWLAEDRSRSLRLGVVFPRGTQEYFLRTWLAMSGLKLGDQVTLAIIPPQEMVGRLRKAEIDGFCSGEPWTRRASASKLGRRVADSGAYLRGLGEKVLAVRESWHKSHPGEHARMLRALSAAADWMSDPANLPEAVEILAGKKYVNTPKPMVEGALADLLEEHLRPLAGGGIQFRGDPPSFPERGHALWYLEQMIRWGHAKPGDESRLDLERICLEDFHRQVLASRTSA